MTPDQIKTAGAAELNRLAAEAQGWKLVEPEKYMTLLIMGMQWKRGVGQRRIYDHDWNPSKDHNQAHELIQHGIDTWGEDFKSTYAVMLERITDYSDGPLFANAEQKTRAALLAICELEGGE